MTAPPFPEVPSPRLGPFPRRSNAWPFLAFLCIVVIGAKLLWIDQPPLSPAAQSGSTLPSAPVSVAFDAGPVNTAIALALATATPTLTPVPTATATTAITLAMTYGYCAPSSPAGTVCVPNRPTPVTPPAIPTCYPGTLAMLCQVPGDPNLTSANGETQ
jgi:hypothetical protein